MLLFQWTIWWILLSVESLFLETYLYYTKEWSFLSPRCFNGEVVAEDKNVYTGELSMICYGLIDPWKWINYFFWFTNWSWTVAKLSGKVVLNIYHFLTHEEQLSLLICKTKTLKIALGFCLIIVEIICYFPVNGVDLGTIVTLFMSFLHFL